MTLTSQRACKNACNPPQLCFRIRSLIVVQDSSSEGWLRRRGSHPHELAWPWKDFPILCRGLWPRFSPWFSRSSVAEPWRDSSRRLSFTRLDIRGMYEILLYQILIVYLEEVDKKNAWNTEDNHTRKNMHIYWCKYVFIYSHKGLNYFFAPLELTLAARSYLLLIRQCL